MTNIEKASIGVLIAIFILAGAGIGWLIWHQPKVVETAAVEIRQPDQSLIPEKVPAAAPRLTHQIPKGGKVEREVSVTVKPAAPPAVVDGKPNCPPVRVDLSLVRVADQTRRVVASSPDGTVVTGLDVPIETPTVPEPKPWAVGVSYDPVHATPGIWVERDLWRVRAGVEVSQTKPLAGGPTGVETRIRIGFTF